MYSGLVGSEMCIRDRFGWSVEKVGPVQDKTLYESAKSFAESVSKGDVKAKHGNDSTKSEDEVPF